MNVSSVAHFVGSEDFRFAFPQARLPSPGAITLSASFAGWLNDFFQQFSWLRLGRAESSVVNKLSTSPHHRGLTEEEDQSGS